jgi:succinate dehydrogenase hydrophobic anchor subunit
MQRGWGIPASQRPATRLTRRCMLWLLMAAVPLHVHGRNGASLLLADAMRADAMRGYVLAPF